MSQDRLPPPDPEACLVRLRPSTQKGGTIIAEDVTERATHERRICDPDGYRPPFCPACGERHLHVHDYRERVLRAEPDTPVGTIVRHACVACRAIWQVLPAFIARHLWRTWRVVAHTLTPDAGRPAAAEAPRWPKVPGRTARRWRARWRRRRQANPSPRWRHWCTDSNRRSVSCNPSRVALPGGTAACRGDDPPNSG